MSGRPGPTARCARCGARHRPTAAALERARRSTHCPLMCSGLCKVLWIKAMAKLGREERASLRREADERRRADLARSRRA